MNIPGSTDAGASTLISEGDLETIAREAAEVLREARVTFHRGRPFDFALKLAHLNAALTSPLVPARHVRVAISLKVLYVLWNVVVDDEIDRDNTTRGIDASIAFLLTEGANDEVDHAGASRLLACMAALVPAGRIRRSEALGFDLLEVIQGLNFERFVSSNVVLATEFEYRRYGTMTASLKVLLDIDCLFVDPPLDGPSYAVLREVYDELTCAIKLASDIGTLRREVHEENSTNLLRILASSARQGSGESQGVDQTMAAAMQYREQVAGEASAHVRRARTLLARVPRLEMRRFLGAVEKIVEVYASGVDPFFA